MFPLSARRSVLREGLRGEARRSERVNDDGRKGWFLIPFIPNVTDKFKHITNRLKSKLVYFSLHKLGWRIVRAQKDCLPIDSNKNRV